MTPAILSSKYQIVVPKEIRKQLHLHSGQRMLFLVKGGVISLIPERPLSELKGIARGLKSGPLREKKDRSVWNIIDSSAWIEFAMDGKWADRIEGYLKDRAKVITPSIIIYEVYKRLKRESSEMVADAIIAEISKTQIIPLDDRLALAAAEVSLELDLAMADAIIYTTARIHHAHLVTCDSDFKKLPSVIYLKK